MTIESVVVAAFARAPNSAADKSAINPSFLFISRFLSVRGLYICPRALSASALRRTDWRLICTESCHLLREPSVGPPPLITPKRDVATAVHCLEDCAADVTANEEVP